MTHAILGLAHVGVPVASLEEAIPLWTKLGFRLEKTETLDGMKLRIAYMEAGGAMVELLQPTDSETPIGRFLARRGGGIHHLAFEVPDLEAALTHAEAEGFELIDRTPRQGGHGMQIAFLHPRSLGGVLVELCERRKS
ncbi:MAG: methylmalonyl-CoA epimerase [Candidatus Eiseniibacteriota bacterium]